MKLLCGFVARAAPSTFPSLSPIVSRTATQTPGGGTVTASTVTLSPAGWFATVIAPLCAPEESPVTEDAEDEGTVRPSSFPKNQVPARSTPTMTPTTKEEVEKLFIIRE